MTLSPDDLNGLDRQILKNLTEGGRATPTLMLKLLGEEQYSRQYVNQRMKRLSEHGHIRNVLDTGVYEPVDDPREGNNAE